jgi:hypothetical protein
MVGTRLLLSLAAAIAVCAGSDSFAYAQPGAPVANDHGLSALMREVDEGRWITIASAVCHSRRRSREVDALSDEVNALRARYTQIMGEDPPSGFMIIESRSCWSERVYKQNLNSTREQIRRANIEMDQLGAGATERGTR